MRPPPRPTRVPGVKYWPPTAPPGRSSPPLCQRIHDHRETGARLEAARNPGRAPLPRRGPPALEDAVPSLPLLRELRRRLVRPPRPSQAPPASRTRPRRPTPVDAPDHPRHPGRSLGHLPGRWTGLRRAALKAGGAQGRQSGQRQGRTRHGPPRPGLNDYKPPRRPNLTDPQSVRFSHVYAIVWP